MGCCKLVRSSSAVPPCRFDLLFRQPLKDVAQLTYEAILELLGIGNGLLGGSNETAKILLADASGIKPVDGATKLVCDVQEAGVPPFFEECHQHRGDDGACGENERVSNR